MTKDKFNEWLDEEYGYFEICGQDYAASEIMQTLSPGKYSQEYKEWFDKREKANRKFINETN